MRRVRRKGANKEKVFGCDLLEHLAASGQEIPQVLRNCSEFIELNGIVDGIYRLSGVSSNIQKLRSEFDSEGSPDLNKDLYLQDIHCVSSLCKAYFRELPNPLLTYQLYDKFAEAVAIQLEEERLVKIRDVLKELPSLHHRTLEFLMRHLVRVASHSSETNMHSRNLAIVWAPNLLRSKDIEASGFNGTAAFMEVRVQSIVVEFILTHVSQLFPEEGTSLERRKSLPSPTAMSNQEEPIFRSVQPLSNYGNISPGDGPLPIRPYHAIIEGTDKRKGSLKGRKWMSIFNIGGRFHDPRRRNKNSTKEKDRPGLRPARSMDSLSSPSYPKEASRHPAQRPPSTVISPLAGPSPQGGTEVTASAGAVHGSGYAVTYRRGTGVVSGGGGTQGTYSLLDPEGLGAAVEEGRPHQSRSPGLASKRRAVMHITGPHLVTVPLHITSNLALGVLQGGGGDRVIHCRDKDGGARVEGKGGGEKQERKNGKGMERKEGGGGAVAVKDVKVDKNNGEDVKDEGPGKEKGTPEVEGGGAEEKAEGEKEDERDEEAAREDERLKTEQEGRGESGEQDGKHLNYTEEDNDEDYDDEYMDMKAAEPVAPAAPGSPASVTSAPGVDSVSDVSNFLNSEEVDGDDQELSGYVQDNFDFLDHMDCSMSSQMNEFSVEPPGYEDDEYEVMEQHLPCHVLQAPAEVQPPPGSAPTQLNSHRPLSTDVNGRHVKSLSLPYMTLPFLPAQYSSEEEAADDDNDDEYSNDEEDMFYKSLPSGYILDWPDDVPSPQSPLSSRTVDRVDQSQSSEDRRPEPLDVESPVCNEVKDEEALEKKEQGEEEEEEDKVDQEENIQIQSTVTPEDLLREDDASIVEGDPGDAEKSTTCCVEFPQPRTEDDDGTDTEADTKVEDEKEVVENPHSNGESSGGHFDDASDESGARVSVTFPTHRKVSCTAQGEIVGVSTEVSRKLSVGPIEQPETCGRKGGEGERDEGEEGKVDEELEDRIGGAVAKEEIQENKQGEQIEGGGEGEGEEHGEKRQEVGEDDVQIWEEFENFICEMIEYEESKNPEKKDASDGMAGEGKMTGDVVKVGEEEEQIGRGNIEMEKVGILSEDTKVSEEGTREEEEGVIIKREVEKEAVEEPKEENHKDPEMQQDVETKEIHLPKKIELNDENEAGEIREKGAIKEEERMSVHHRYEEEADSKVQKKENEDKEQPQTLSSVDEKEKRLQDVKSDIKESKESKFEESSSSSQGSETGVGRKLVISKQAPAKLYQVKSVPVVPPKPQHCRLTALSLRQQQQRERGDGDRERGSVARAAAEQNKDQERETEAKTERERACEGEQGKDGEREDESRGKKERHVLKGGERERRRDGDEGGTRDTNRNSPLSMCFDEAVAIATMRRGREKESERERERQRDWGYEVQ